MENIFDKLNNIFPIICPISQHVTLLILISVWLWQWQLYLLGKYFEVGKIVSIKSPFDTYQYLSTPKLVNKTRLLALKMTKVILPWHIITSLLLKKILEDNLGTPPLIIFLINISPLCQLVVIFVLLFHESYILKTCLKRIFKFGGIEPKPLRINYILISDTFTSFSKPLIDFSLYLSRFLFDPFDSNCILTRNQTMITMNLDLLIGATPILIRILQCIKEWRSSTNSRSSKVAIFNTLKYFSYFPIIMCTVIARIYDNNIVGDKIYWFMLFNGMYTFWWDITMDWKLCFLNFTSRGMKQNTILRTEKLFKPWHYYMAILADFILRFIWLWELLSGVSILTGEINLFLQQCLELFRRWIWIFFKLEAEYIFSTLNEKNEK